MDSEFSLIERIRRRCVNRPDVLLGIGDDAALVQPRADEALVVCTDTLVAGVHFPLDTAPADIGWKALAVNLSDLAAMGARPAWCTLALTLPDSDAAWLEAMLDGFGELASVHGVALVGGDTTRGPLSLTVTALGQVPAASTLRRAGARAGDEIWVTGTLGDAAGALSQWQAGVAIDVQLRARLDRPTPRVAAGLALRGLASACIDISDGLTADLGHVLTASGVAAELELEALPASAALQAHFAADARWPLQVAGGDDYELCFTAAAAQAAAVQAALAACGVAATRIGRIVEGRGLHLRDGHGANWPPPRSGYDHFAAGKATAGGEGKP